MKKGFVVIVSLVVIASSGVDCNSYSSDPYGATTQPTSVPPNTVVMSGLTFSPSTITIQRGTTLTWQNDDGVVHTSTSDSTGWDTGNIAAHASATTQFSTAGTFRYHCVYHRAMGMVGTVVVQ